MVLSHKIDTYYWNLKSWLSVRRATIFFLKEELQNLHAVSSRIVRDSRPFLPRRLQSRPADIDDFTLKLMRSAMRL